jgi:hypothetical protein
LISQHSIESYEEFSCDSDEGDFAGLGGLRDAVGEGFEVRAGSRSDKGSHIEGPSDAGASAGDAALALELTGIMVEGCQPCEGGQALWAGVADLGHEGEQDLGGDRSDARCAGQQAGLPA